jgi:phytoene desaturase
VRGLFFCGGTAHPGGGVPMVTLSGKAAAEMVLKEL